MKNIFILGLGEIGLAISKIEESAGNTVYFRDLGDAVVKNDGLYDIIHVCIPFVSKSQFLNILDTELADLSAEVVIIHSTVEIGTTRAAQEMFYGTGHHFVHSFCRGVHPNLELGIRTFEKAIGGTSMFSAVAKLHLESLGIRVKVLSSPESSEAAKLLSTTYYGYCILFAKAANELCEDLGLDYDEVYTWSNETYNEGYNELGMSQVCRPVLSPPAGRIGGHCVVPNFHLLPPSDLKDYCIKQESDGDEE